MRFDTRRARRCAIRGPIPALLLLVALIIAVPAQAEWLQGEQAIMGTRCVVELWSTDRARGQAAIDAVFTEFRRIDELMSTPIEAKQIFPTVGEWEPVALEEADGHMVARWLIDAMEQTGWMKDGKHLGAR